MSNPRYDRTDRNLRESRDFDGALPKRNVELGIPEIARIPRKVLRMTVDTLPEATAPTEVSVSVAKLALGRALQFPMHDANGILLLAEGAVITPEFKRLLEARQVQSVHVRPEDAAFMTGEAPATPPPPPRAILPKFDERVSAQIEKTIHRWMSGNSNRGPALKQRMTPRGKEAIDPQFEKEITHQNLRTTATLTNMMGQAAHGRFTQVAGSILNAIQSSIKLMTTDMDGVLAQRLSGCPDSQLARHCLRMAQWSMAIAIEMGLNADNVGKIGVTALLHDWGMLRVSEAVRYADHPLTQNERLELQRHVSYSVDMLERIEGLPTLVPLVSYQVHEKLDGSGYPRRKLEPSIHLFARILHVADDFVTLTAPNGWRPAVLPYAAMAGMLRQDFGRAADVSVLRAFLRAAGLFPPGSYVRLSDGSEAIVLRAQGDAYTQPVVRLIQDAAGRAIDPGEPEACVSLMESDLRIIAALPTPGEDELTEIPDERTWRRIEAAHPAVPAPKLFGALAAQQGFDPRPRPATERTGATVN